MFKLITKITIGCLRDIYVLAFCSRISLCSLWAKILAIIWWVFLSALTQCNFLIKEVMTFQKLIFARLLGFYFKSDVVLWLWKHLFGLDRDIFSSVRILILVNSLPKDYFYCSRGIQQGDPFVFVIVL